MATQSPRSVAADLLRYIAAHDHRTVTPDEINAWASQVARHPLNTEHDYRQAIEHHYAAEGAHKARPGDIVTEATRIRMARTGANRVPVLERGRTPMPHHIREQIRAIQGRPA